MAASGVYILDLKGRPIISRDYRGDVPPKAVDKFIMKLNETEEQGLLRPLLQAGKVKCGGSCWCRACQDPGPETVGYILMHFFAIL